MRTEPQIDCSHGVPWSECPDRAAHHVQPFEVERYPLAAPCEYCGDPVWDHSPSELASCVLDLDIRRHEAEALEWWKSQQ